MKCPGMERFAWLSAIFWTSQVFLYELSGIALINTHTQLVGEALPNFEDSS